MLSIQYGFCKLIITDGFIVLRNNEFTTATIIGPIYKSDRNIDDYVPIEDGGASSYFAIPMYIANALKDKLVYKWEIYNEINKFSHRTAYELYELITDYSEYCKTVSKGVFHNTDKILFFYREGIHEEIKFITDILEARHPSLKMEYKLRQW